jgi:Uma2 family endonuclease
MVDSAFKPIVEYPESDGLPMSESDVTRNYLIYCVESLRLFFESRPQVYVSGNLFIYYQEGHTEKNISPDVFVIFGVSKDVRRSYKSWEEGGHLPSFVLEITSLSTRNNDEVTKPELYASLGVEEYFQYDPTGDYLNPPLKGRRLVDGQYQPIEPDRFDDGTVSIRSQVLGLDLRLLPWEVPLSALRAQQLSGRSLRLFDPQTGTKLLTYRELEEARQQAEHKAREDERRANQEAERANQEAERANQEAARSQRLIAKLRELGISLDDVSLDDV